MLKKTLIVTAVLSVAATVCMATGGRDHLEIVGSSTVYPFATTVAEQYGKTTKFKTPKVEATGSGGGFKLFCAGVGVETPDITNASRAMKKSEYDTCNTNGVKEVIEVKIGYDGIVLGNARAAQQMNISRKDLYLALAREVPDPQGTDKLVKNPYRTWKEINAALPARRIEVLGPPPTSGTRDAFTELVMDEGCKEYDFIKAMDKKTRKAVCRAVREDGAFIEAGENDNLIVQKLEANPDALGIFGFSFLDQNQDKIQGSLVDGEMPTFENIADGKYPISRSLYFYVKKAHVGVIPGIREYLDEFTSDRAWGEEGYLSDKGLIPMPDDERENVAASVKALRPLTM